LRSLDATEFRLRRLRTSAPRNSASTITCRISLGDVVEAVPAEPL
jgi:hypothetical protein